MIYLGLFFFCAVYTVSSHTHPDKFENAPFHVTLDPQGKYQLFWNFDDHEIVFEVQVEALGYVGLGLSPNGGMAGSDIAIGWVEDATGKVVLQDRFASGNFEPVMDFVSDYTMLSGSQNGSHTTIRFSRQLDLCSGEDFKITPDTIRVIWAYSDTDPVQGGSLMYHGEHRGVRSVQLLGYTGELPALPSDIVTLDLLNANILIPANDTTYWCTSFAFPKLNGKHHVIQVEPVVQPGREKEVHHIVLYNCRYSLNSSIGHSQVCRQPSAPSEWKDCFSLYYAWAVGGGVFTLPEHVGLPIGDSDEPRMFMMETHYDNPRLQSGMRDSSGLRLIMTSQLRKFDGGVMDTGVGVWESHVIPPYYEEFLSEGNCMSDCLSQAMGNRTEKINVFATMLHSHLAGRKIRLGHIRDGVEQAVIAQDNNYDFNFQEVRMLPKERVIRKGDRLLVQCVYNTEDRKTMTYSGEGTKEEMCIGFVFYYPKIPLSFCTTQPTAHFNIGFKGATADFQISPGIITPPEYKGQNWKVFFEKAIDWSSPKVREQFQKYSLTKDYPGHFSLCVDGPVQYPANFKVVSMPSIRRALPKESDCGGIGAGASRVTFSCLALFIITALTIPIV